MKYALLIYGNEQAWASLGEAEMRALYEEHGAYGKAMAEAGVLRGGEELAPTNTATTVRFSNGRNSLVDGPFAETREQLGGYYIIDVADLAAATEWARKVPIIPGGKVEIRPVGAH